MAVIKHAFIVNMIIWKLQYAFTVVILIHTI